MFFIFTGNKNFAEATKNFQNLHLSWDHGHTDVLDNELCDKLAVEARSIQDPMFQLFPLTKSPLKKLLKQSARQN